MRIADGLEMLEISATIMGQKNVIYPVLLWDKNEVILIDTGYPGQMPLIFEGMKQAGIASHQLSKVLMTHQDIDHIGNLAAILKEMPEQIEVISHEIEKPYIQGDLQLIKLTKEAVKQAVASLPKDIPAELRHAFQSILENPPKAPVDKTVSDGEQLPYCGGIIVIETKGHTPGHISLYHKASKTLIAGDAMVVMNEELQYSPAQHCVDSDMAKQSLKKLAHYDIDTVICYHGGRYRTNVNARILELAFPEA